MTAPAVAQPVRRALEIVTLNVWGLPWPLSRRPGSRLAAIASHFGERTDDILGLQEVWGGVHRALACLSPARPHGPRDSGLALGGRLGTAERPRLHPFRQASSVDRLKDKGVLQAVVDVPTISPVHVLVTHLQAGWRHAEARARQVDEVLRLASRVRGPLVLMGDLNLFDEHPVDEASACRIALEGLVDVAATVGRPDPTWHPEDGLFRRRGRGQRFDRIYVRGGGGVALEPEDVRVLGAQVPLSDHRPLWARVTARRTS